MSDGTAVAILRCPRCGGTEASSPGGAELIWYCVNCDVPLLHFPVTWTPPKPRSVWARIVAALRRMFA